MLRGLLIVAGPQVRPPDAAAPPAMGSMALTAEVAPAPFSASRPTAATLRPLITLLTARETDLKDLLLDLYKPRHSAAHKGELLLHPRGPAGDVRGPKGTTGIARTAFAGCSSLTEIALPPTLTAIGRYAVACYTSLNTITLPP